MKKVLILIIVAAFLSACSQYTCPTYAKVEKQESSKLN